MKERIGRREAQCLSCKLCEEGCPTGVDLVEAVRLQRYLDGIRGSHGSVFLTLSAMNAGGSWRFDEGEVDPTSEVVFFPGCTPLYDTAFQTVSGQPYGDYSAMARERKYSSIGLAALRLLNAMEIKPRMETACCGHDLYYAGRLNEFEARRKDLRSALGDARLIVTPCAECAHALRDLHGLHAVHIAQFLMERRDALPLRRTNLKVMYHDPCRLGRFLGVYDQPRELISSVAELFEFERKREESVCCGVSSWMNCNRASKELRKEKMEEFERSGADLLVTACPKCAMHLDCLYYERGEEGLEREGVNIIDLSELLAMAMGRWSIDEVTVRRFSPTGGRGRIAPIPTDKDPMRYIDQGTKENIFNCSTCYYCTAVCPTGHETPELMRRVREYMVSTGLNPDRHRRVHDNIVSTGNPYGEKERFAHERKGAELIYFPGCTSVYRTREMVDDTMFILDRLGVAYTVPEGLVCCGSPEMRSGYGGEEVKRINSEIIDRGVIVSCAGCHATLLNDYEGVEVRHIVELLAEGIDQLPLRRLDMRVTYHDPCHLGREFGMYDEPRRVITSIPGVELIEFDRSREHSQCCGGGGGLRSWNPEKSLELARERMREAESLGVDAVVSACPFCKLNLQAAGKLEVLDLVELVRRSIESV